MSRIKLLSWNAQNALGDRERSRIAVEEIAKTEADIMYFPETADAIDSREQDELHKVTERLRTLGYHALALTHYYEGEPPFGHRNHIMSMWGRDAYSSSAQKFGNRYGIVTRPAGALFVGMHHEDYSEDERVDAASDLVNYLDNLAQFPQVIMGDFNAMLSRDTKARRMSQIIRPATQELRHSLPESFEYYGNQKQNKIMKKLSRVASLGIRLADMSAGDTMKVYEDAGFVNADDTLQPTIAMGTGNRPLFKIDHIIGRGVAFEGHEVHQTDVSDHALLSVSAYY